MLPDSFMQVVTIRRLAVTETETRALGNYKSALVRMQYHIMFARLSITGIVSKSLFQISFKTKQKL
jgi:hypothetical protein